jgi:hypothetical protein
VLSSTLFTSAQYLPDEALFQYNCDETITIDMQQNNPGMQVYDQGINGIIGASTSFDPGTGELTLFTGAIQGPKSYGTFEIVVDDNGQLTYYTVYLIDCCIKGLKPDKIIVAEPSSNLPNPGLLVNQTVLVLDVFEINIPTQIVSSKLYFGSEARMRVFPDQHLYIEHSGLTNYCPYRWDGVLAEGENTEIIFESSELSGSGRGFSLSENVLFTVNGGTFLDNTISISASNYNQQGNFYNQSRWSVEGTSFTLPLNQISFASGSVIEPLVAQVLGCFTCAVHVYLNDSEQIQLGNANAGQNSYVGQDGTAILANSSFFIVENSIVDNMAKSIVANHSKFRLGGPDMSYSNTISTFSYLESSFSSQSIKRNTFANSRITITNPTNYLIDGISGTKLDSNEILETPTSIVKWYNSGINENVRFGDNQVVDCSVSLEGFTTPSINEGVLIEYNDFEYPFGGFGSSFQTQPQGTYSLNLTSMPGVRVGHNKFIADITVPIGFPPIPVPNNRAGGMHLINVPDAQIKDNNFDSCHIAIFGEDDLSGTLFCYNFMNGGYYGMYFNQATLSDQGTPTENVGNGFDGQLLNTIFLKACPGPSKYHTWPGSSYDPTLPPGISWNPNQFLNNPWQPDFNGTTWINECDVLNKTNPRKGGLTKQEFSVYPIPFQHEFLIEIPVLFEEEELHYQGFLFNINGKVVHNTSLTTGLNTLIPKIVPGVYFLRIETKKGEFVFVN